ncbi:MAG TPA: hypothetical protein VFS00_21145 [Polyangiaceae bacterium]|nr:hypothetical protein [Polyangiaceae bacterium]
MADRFRRHADRHDPADGAPRRLSEFLATERLACVDSIGGEFSVDVGALATRSSCGTPRRPFPCVAIHKRPLDGQVFALFFHARDGESLRAVGRALLEAAERADA